MVMVSPTLPDPSLKYRLAASEWCGRDAELFVRQCNLTNMLGGGIPSQMPMYVVSTYLLANCVSPRTKANMVCGCYLVHSFMLSNFYRLDLLIKYLELHQQIYDETSTTSILEVEPPLIQSWLSKVHGC